MILNYTKEVNSSKLHEEITALSIAGFSGVNQLSAGVVDVVFSSDISQGDQDAVAAVVAAHTTTYPQEYVEDAIKAQVEFGNALISLWGIRVGMTGKTQPQIDSLLDNADFLKIGMGVMTGSLLYAKNKITAITPWDGFTQGDKDWFLGKINTFLGV